MPVEITSLASLDPADVTQALAATVQMLQEAEPTLDFRRGVVHDLLLYLGALLSTQIRAGVLARYLSARSLIDIEADPTLADPGVVDSVLSNYLITRNAGTTATGSVTIVLSSPVSVTIANGAVFTADGNTYQTSSTYTAKTEAAQINNSSDRLLTQLDDGNWAFVITVTATAIGAAGLIQINTLVIPTIQPTNYVTSYATSDFTGGLDSETNAELITELQNGIAAKAPSNRTNMQAMLRADASFTAVIGSSIVGYGDPEMLRDQHTLWPGSLGGRVDWYIRTTAQVLNLSLSKAATLLSVAADGSSSWQVSIGRDDAPGFYEIVSILPPAAANLSGTCTVTADVRSLDLTGTGFIPDIQTVPEGAYSRFQTSIIQFTDPRSTSATNLSPGATSLYNVVVSVLPQIDQIQDYISSPAIRSMAADVLIKAPVPCFVTVYFRVARSRVQADPDVNGIATAVAAAINAVGFTGRLYASTITDAAAGFLASGMSTGGIDLLGTIRAPDGQIIYLRDEGPLPRGVLIVPEIAGDMVGARTVQFFATPADINVEISVEVPTT